MAFGACRFLVIAYLSSIAPFCGRVLFRSLLSESKKDIKDSARLEIMSSAANFPLRTRGHGGTGARQRGSAFSSPPHSIGFAVVVGTPILGRARPVNGHACAPKLGDHFCTGAQHVTRS